LALQLRAAAISGIAAAGASYLTALGAEVVRPKQQQLLSKVQASPFNSYPGLCVWYCLDVRVMVDAYGQPDENTPCKAATAKERDTQGS
jgi:hypothetical protein